MENNTTLAVANSMQEEVRNYIFKAFGEDGISDVQMAMALKLCQEYNLSPLRREIHFLPFKNDKGKKDLQPVIAYTEYIKKAQATGNLNGYEYDREGEGDNLKCIVTIYRKDRDYPFKHTVFFKEVAQRNREGKTNANWTKKPNFMISKVAIAQAMRLAFPEELSAMPYEESEAWNVIDGNKTQEIPADSVTILTSIIPEVQQEEEKQPITTPLKELKTARVKKMGDDFSLLSKWFKLQYNVDRGIDLTEDQANEMRFELQDKSKAQIMDHIIHLEAPAVVEHNSPMSEIVSDLVTD